MRTTTDLFKEFCFKDILEQTLTPQLELKTTAVAGAKGRADGDTSPSPELHSA